MYIVYFHVYSVNDNVTQVYNVDNSEMQRLISYRYSATQMIQCFMIKSMSTAVFLSDSPVIKSAMCFEVIVLGVSQ